MNNENMTLIEVCQAIVNGKSLQFSRHNTGPWYAFEPESTISSIDLAKYHYRITILEKPSVDWSTVAPAFKYLARDGSGRLYFYTHKPVRSETIWWRDGGEMANAKAHITTPGNCDWKDSVVSRPMMKPITKPSINWDRVHERYKFLAKDRAGIPYLFDNEPTLGETGWISTVRSSFTQVGTNRVDLGNCDWKDSLVQRPE